MVTHYLTEKEAYENHLERGDVVRVTDVLYECEECGARTNKVILGGYQGYGLRRVCPSDEFKSENLHKPVPKNIEDIEGLDQKHIIKKFTPSARPLSILSKEKLKEKILAKYSLK